MSDFTRLQLEVVDLMARVASLEERHVFKPEPQPVGRPRPGQVYLSGLGWIDPPDEPKPQKEESNLSMFVALREERDATREEVKRLEAENKMYEAGCEYTNRIASLQKENEQLRADYKASEFVRIRFTEAFGLVTTIKGDMEIRPDNPLWNANELVEYVAQLRSQVPKERLQVRITQYGAEWFAFNPQTGTRMSRYISKEKLVQWCADHGLEVVE